MDDLVRATLTNCRQCVEWEALQKKKFSVGFKLQSLCLAVDLNNNLVVHIDRLYV